MANEQATLTLSGTEAATARTPPGPSTGDFVRRMLGPRRDQLDALVADWRTYGDVVYYNLPGGREVYLAAHPDAVQHVLRDNHSGYVKGRGLEKAKPLLGEGLLTSEGDFWLRQRRLIQPEFKRRHLAAFAATMVDCTEEMLAEWHASAQSGEPLDVAEHMMRLTLEIVSRTLFSTGLSDEDARAVGGALRPILRVANRRIRSLIDTPEWLPTPDNRAFERHRATLDEVVYRIIETRRQSGQAHDDLLGRLMAARDPETGEAMSDRQLRDEVMTLFLAGHETTANHLAWTWTLLSRHPDVRRRVQAEVDDALEGRAPTPDDLGQLAYTRQVIDESLRLYPPAWAVSRRPLADDEVAGYRLHAGSSVVISPYITHRHPDFWTNPEGFDPARFAPGWEREQHLYAYIPFGGGPRLCIGQHFALMESTIVVALVSARYALDLVPGRPVEHEAPFTLRPKDGVWMTLRART